MLRSYNREDLLEFSCEETPFLSDMEIKFEMSLLEKVVAVEELGKNHSG
jgi:hypothetical protein